MGNIDKIEEILSTIPEDNSDLHFDIYDEFDYITFVTNIMEIRRKQEQNLVYKLSKYKNN